MKLNWCYGLPIYGKSCVFTPEQQTSEIYCCRKTAVYVISSRLLCAVVHSPDFSDLGTLELHYSRQFSHQFCWRCGSNVTRFKHTALLHCVFLFKYPKWQCGLKNGDQHDGVANVQNPHCSRVTFGEPCFACYKRGYSVYIYINNI